MTGLKRVFVLLLSLVMLLSIAPAMAEETPAGGTIMWLSNQSSGLQYDSSVKYAEAICKELGYNFKVVYGDTFNDAAGNLQAVKNAMTSDVVALIATQDGGLSSIMEEYPNLYVVGYNADMRSVFTEGGINAACLNSDHFLGTIADGPVSGEDLAQYYVNVCLEKGYKKVAVVTFPEYAYPIFIEADIAFRKAIEEYNGTASDDARITIVGDSTVLMFSPMEDSWFLEDGHSDLDAIIGICDGVAFIYPVLKTAVINGLCSPSTQLVALGISEDEGIIADVGEGVTIGSLFIPPTDNIAWCIAMIDSAVIGKKYPDFEKPEQVDGIEYIIDSQDDMANVMHYSLIGTTNPENSQISMEELKNAMPRFNPDATYAQLKSLFTLEKLSVENFGK